MRTTTRPSSTRRVPRRGTGLTLGVAVALAAAACGDATAPTATDASFDLTPAFASLPLGYADVSTSFAGGPGASAWMGQGRGRGPGTAGLMGGGLSDAFGGGQAFGRHGGHGPFGGGAACLTGTFDAASGRVVCAPLTLPNGLTVARSAAYTDASGRVQQAFDSTSTNTVNLRTATTGTATLSDSAGGRGPGGFGFEPRGGRRRAPGGRDRRGGPLLGDTATILTLSTTVANVSERTTGGLAAGSTQRTVEATSSSRETITGTSSRGQFTASRVAGDTTRGLVVPVATAGTATYPTAGTVIRGMQATLTYVGGTASSASRREVLTYDGSATARLVITENGTTRTCSVALPRGRPVCG
jgi:hypothetical protein